MAVKGNALLRRCLTRCRHCGIFFLTDVRNSKRDDLRCPFGCREAHRKEKSNERSQEYYRSDVGRIKKRIQNEKRRVATAAAAVASISTATTVPSSDQQTPDSESCAPSMISYLQVLVGLIESRRVMRAEILTLVARVLRQHSMARVRRVDHSVAWLNESSP